MRQSLLIVALMALMLVTPAEADALQPFAIEVVDANTGRGVPLVELETVNNLRFVTDSSGVSAIVDPELMGRTVYFNIRSHGYEFPKDRFGFRGKALKVDPGGRARLEIRRINIAERLYRVTGGGIYRDTLLIGDKPPLKKPLLNAQVVGCDSVLTVVYGAKLFWFWGDTNRRSYPLGNFHVTGATSLLPDSGGLDPEIGVNLNYFVGQNGFVRSMAQMPGEGPTWMGRLTVLRESNGLKRMYASYVKIRKPLEAYRWGYAVWNEEVQRFDQVTSFDEPPPMHLGTQGHSFHRREDNGTEYVYFASPFPLTRVRAHPEAFVDPVQYEGFTCLKAGTRPQDKQLDHATNGQLRYSWKLNTPPLTQDEQNMLIRDGRMHSAEALIGLRDPDTGRDVHAHSGSVYWNKHRRRWVMIAVELNGESSFLGEVWYAEADTPTGPWGYARKVVSHDRYSFYNPKQHRFFDKEGGRIIFFEGTYTHTFSGNSEQTPRYDYNQIMYKLDLSAPRLSLPVAVYRTEKSGEPDSFGLRQPESEVAFFALERPATNTVPVFSSDGILHVGKQPDATTKNGPLFHALPSGVKTSPATTTPLYEFVHTSNRRRAYSIDPEWSGNGFRRTSKPICRVWVRPRF